MCRTGSKWFGDLTTLHVTEKTCLFLLYFHSILPVFHNNTSSNSNNNNSCKTRDFLLPCNRIVVFLKCSFLITFILSLDMIYSCDRVSIYVCWWVNFQEIMISDALSGNDLIHPHLHSFMLVLFTNIPYSYSLFSKPSLSLSERHYYFTSMKQNILTTVIFSNKYKW